MSGSLKNMTQDEMEAFFISIGEKKFRGQQVFQWLYRGILNFDEMTNLPKTLRDKLQSAAKIGSVETVKIQKSKEDGTRKYLFRLSDGNLIESVFMKYKFGNSVCISSQAGCRMGCGFCASAIGGLERNLTAGEMADQIVAIERDTSEKVGNVVIMGTGEPFDNYENLCRFLTLVHNPKGLNLGMRSITVSTCGLVPEMERFSDEFPQVNLAVSLHAPNDEIREKMMPINRKYPLELLMEACRRCTDKTGRRITFEYALVKNINDQEIHIKQLASMLRGMLCHVNLIPLNQVAETGYEGTARESAEQFKTALEKRGVQATIRRELGRDIDAACGQLRLGSRQ